MRVRALALPFCIALAMVATGATDRRPDVPPIGAGQRYALPLGAQALAGDPIGRLRCTPDRGRRVAVHLELFARKKTLLIPAGVGFAGPVFDGVYVRGSRCAYPLLTREPTGLVELDPTVSLTVGDLFDVWGQPLSKVGLAGFDGAVTAYVDGRAVGGDPRAIPLVPHTNVVLEVGGRVPPHPFYVFPPGL